MVNTPAVDRYLLREPTGRPDFAAFLLLTVLRADHREFEIAV
jgi:hypothetical protein